MDTRAILASMLLATLAGEPQSLPPNKAREHDGEKVTICGTVANMHTASDSKGKPTFLDLDSAYPEQVFVVVIWDEDKAQVGPIPPVKSHLCATGTIHYFHGVPQIVVRQSSQLSR